MSTLQQNEGSLKKSAEEDLHVLSSFVVYFVQLDSAKKINKLKYEINLFKS